MKAAVIVMWSRAKLGREAAAVALAPEVAEFWGKQAAAGKCTEPRTYWSQRGPQVWLVEGEYDSLLELTKDEQARRLEMKAGLLLDDFSLEVRPLLDEGLSGRFRRCSVSWVLPDPVLGRSSTPVPRSVPSRAV